MGSAVVVGKVDMVLWGGACAVVAIAAHLAYQWPVADHVARPGDTGTFVRIGAVRLLWIWGSLLLGFAALTGTVRFFCDDPAHRRRFLLRRLLLGLAPLLWSGWCAVRFVREQPIL